MGDLSPAPRSRGSPRPGDRTYLLGDAATHVPLADAGLSSGWVLEPADAVTVLVEYRIPPSAGDDVQTDGVTFDVAFSLEDVPHRVG